MEELRDFETDVEPSSAELPVFCRRLVSCVFTTPAVVLIPKLSFGVLRESELLLVVALSEGSFLSVLPV